ncbi:hypothetical protein ALP05_04379 [Pseudomonas caricapapayae]|uniref:Uncharacterized protein n=1 Tax=Pseudomonas caricapapayae TaxID=46678 RepID=A0A3M6FFT9_9PSED|nr:hypothetical protein ALP05_04379 [Pseudomonas caricapapayae]
MEDWDRYSELMKGARGIYSPGLDPIAVLGIEARTDEERDRFAHLQAIAETKRVQKELEYQRAYDTAVAELNRGQQVINLRPDKMVLNERPPTAPSEVEGSGRLAVFVKPDCQACSVRVKALQQQGTPFDVYMLEDGGSDDKLRSWAIASGIEASKVRQKLITLNHDEGRLEAVLAASGTPLSNSMSFPIALRKTGGKWVRQ